MQTISYIFDISSKQGNLLRKPWQFHWRTPRSAPLVEPPRELETIRSPQPPQEDIVSPPPGRVIRGTAGRGQVIRETLGSHIIHNERNRFANDCLKISPEKQRKELVRSECNELPAERIKNRSAGLSPAGRSAGSVGLPGLERLELVSRPPCKARYTH